MQYGIRSTYLLLIKQTKHMAVRLIQFVCISSCSLTQVIDNFARLLVDWLRVALHCVPEPLRDVKFDRMLLVS